MIELFPSSFTNSEIQRLSLLPNKCYYMLVSTRGREDEWKKPEKNIYAEVGNASQLIYWISCAAHIGTLI